jgi:hypothetical protein
LCGLADEQAHPGGFGADPEIVHAYFQELLPIEAISEPPDWSTDWLEPEWRVGT